MSRRKHQDTIKIPGRYIAVRHEILDSPAWKATGFGARLLYIALHRRLIYKDNNNGNIHLSTRDAAEELGTRQMNIGPWYRELEHYGFIVMTNPPSLGVEGKGKAARWRLTDWRHGKSFDGTKDYLKWDGSLFPRRRRPVPKIGSRSTPRFWVKHPALHIPEAPRASGKPESEAPRASYRAGSPEAHRASYLDKPFPSTEGGEGGEGEGPTAEPGLEASKPNGHDKPTRSDKGGGAKPPSAVAAIRHALDTNAPPERWNEIGAIYPKEVLLQVIEQLPANEGAAAMYGLLPHAMRRDGASEAEIEHALRILARAAKRNN